MSVNDRRASYMSAQRPRVVSNRVGDAEKATPRTSFQSDNMDQMRGSASSQRNRTSRDQNGASEKRSDRTVVTAREKAQGRTRHSVKESASTGNRGEREKARPKRTSHGNVASPGARKEKVQEAGSSILPILAMVLVSR